MRVIELDQRTPEWHRWRRQGITATESAVILGLSPHKTPWRLWAEKIGRAAPENLDAVPQVRFGRENEDKVRGLFELAHDEVVTPMCAQMEGEDSIFRASFDGLTFDDIPVEIKCPGENTISDVKTRGVLSDAYRLYSVQVQHQMMVSGASYGWLVFFDSESEGLIEFKIERDESMIEEIKKAGREFWNKYVLKLKEPPLDKERDFFIPKGEDAVIWATSAMDYSSAECEMKALNERLAVLKERQSRAKTRLLSIMGDHMIGEFAGVRVNRYLRSGSVDYAKLLLDHGLDPLITEQYRGAATEAVRFTRTDRDMPEGVLKDEAESECIIAAQNLPDLWW